MRRAVLAWLLVACSSDPAIVPDGGDPDATADVVGDHVIGNPFDASKDGDATSSKDADIDATDGDALDAGGDATNDGDASALVCPWPKWIYADACVTACSVVSTTCPDGGAGDNVMCSDCAPGDAGGCTIPNWGAPGNDASSCSLYATSSSPKPGGTYYWCCP